MSTPTHTTKFETPTPRRWPVLMVVVASITLAASGCGSSDDATATAAALEGAATQASDDAVGASETTTTTPADESDDQEAEATEGDDHSEDPSADSEHEEESADGNGDVAGDDTEQDDHAEEGESHDDHAEDDGSLGELPTAAADGTPEIGAAVESGSPIPSGTYFLNVLGEDWRLQVDDGQFMFGESDLATSRFSTEALTGTPHFIGLLKTVGIVPPREAGVHQEHDPIVPDVTVDIPAELSTWLDAVPQITVVDTGTSTVAGAPAAWYRLGVDPAAGPTFHCPFGDHCASFVVHPNWGVTVLAPAIDVTVWQLDALPGVMPWVQVEDPAKVELAQQAMADLVAGLSAA